MITDQKRTIRKAQGYDLGFEFKGVEYWINTSKWNEEKAERFYKETGLKAFREEAFNKNLVFYDPEYFEVFKDFYPYLKYVGSVEGDIPQPINASYYADMFSDLSYLKAIDLHNWDVSVIVSTKGMFRNAKIESINLGNWDVQNLKHASSMFSKCTELQELDLSTWNNCNLEEVENMFSTCYNLKKVKLCRIREPTLKAIMCAFYDCCNLDELDLSDWNVSKVQNMRATFNGCSNLKKLCLKGWDTSNVVFLSMLFGRCESLEVLDLTDCIFMNINDENRMFARCEFLQRKYATDKDSELLKRILKDSNSRKENTCDNRSKKNYT